MQLIFFHLQRPFYPVSKEPFVISEASLISEKLGYSLKEMKVLHLNLFHGGLDEQHIISSSFSGDIIKKLKDSVRFNNIVSFLKKENFDIISLNEANDWSQELVEHFFPEYHGVIMKTNTSFSLGIISKFQIQILEEIRTGFHHGLLIVQINEFIFMITHLNPFDGTQRMKEVAIIQEKLLQYKGGYEIILLGDLNSLSQKDENFYIQNQALTKLNASTSLQKKFLVNGEFDFRILAYLTESLFVDANTNLHSFQNSVPTKIEIDKNHTATPLRLDYCLVSPSLVSKIQTCIIWKTPQTEYLSDHFPLLLELNS